MIPIVREFFRGLRERDELDAIIPELLTAMGYEVLSRPMIGPRQYGADVAAIGMDTDGIRKLFLFSIKRGDLNRQEWNGSSDQALRPSLEEIKDAYLRSVAPEHHELPVIICPTIGGVVLENVQPLINGYMDQAQTDRIKFRVWTGDTLTAKIVDGALREEVFPAELRDLLRKAAALVDEPDASLRHFSRLIEKVVGNATQDELSRVRVLYLALWILAIWGRDEGNLEAPYQASEIVVMRAWELLRKRIETDRSRKQESSHALFEVITLHKRIWSDLYGHKIAPHAGSDHALSFAVRSRRSLDINLALFETVGRIAVGGLWQLWEETSAGSPLGAIAKPSDGLAAIAESLAAMIQSNPALCTPVKEDQGIDLSLALLLLLAVPSTRAAAHSWLRQTTNAISVCLAVGRYFPVTTRDYSELLRPHEPAEFKDKTAGSIIQPILASASLALEDAELLGRLSGLQQEKLSHSNYQSWVPNERTEDLIWKGIAWQGSSLGSLEIGTDGIALWEAFQKESEANQAYRKLSAIELDHWPMLLLACRGLRLPPPPQIWLNLIDDLRKVGPEFAQQRVRRGGRARIKTIALLSTSISAILSNPTSIASSP